MGRSSKEEAARTRRRIVATASKLFRKHGVDQVSVADIMAVLGLTTGAFYRHFPSKEALVAEGFDLAFTQSTKAWQDLLAPDGPDPATPEAIIAHYLRPDPHQRCPMIAFAAHAAASSRDAPARDIYRHGTEVLLESLTASATSEEARQDVMLLFAAMIGARVLKEAAGDAAWVDELREVVLGAAKAAA